MLTFHVPLALAVAAISVVGVLLIAFTLMVRWFIGAMGIMRAERLEVRLAELLAAQNREFQSAMQGLVTSMGETEGRVRELGMELKAASARVAALTPPGIRKAVEAQINWLGEQLAAAARAEEQTAKVNSHRSRAWIRALAGGSTAEIAEVARLGYGDDFEDDLKGRLDVCAARQRVTIARRDTAAAIRELRPQHWPTGSVQAPRPPRSGPSASGHGRE
jgi:hypothetical protein